MARPKKPEADRKKYFVIARVSEKEYDRAKKALKTALSEMRK